MQHMLSPYGEPTARNNHESIVKLEKTQTITNGEMRMRKKKHIGLGRRQRLHVTYAWGGWIVWEVRPSAFFFASELEEI